MSTRAVVAVIDVLTGGPLGFVGTGTGAGLVALAVGAGWGLGAVGAVRIGLAGLLGAALAAFATLGAAVGFAAAAGLPLCDFPFVFATDGP